MKMKQQPTCFSGLKNCWASLFSKRQNTNESIRLLHPKARHQESDQELETTKQVEISHSTEAQIIWTHYIDGKFDFSQIDQF
ncbi:MAG: hypothetical protein M3R00_06365, partial [Pseudomonadota bacterium]|nr:hypothetical protein [Pseudomonadota bacterium]